MPPDNRDARVDDFLEALGHARQEEISMIRLALLAAEPELVETVKWNAPSFRYGGEDRVTLRLRPGDRLQVVLHRGVRVRDDLDTFVFADPSGLLVWAAPDRAVVTLADADQTRSRLGDLTDLVSRWIRV